MMWRQSRWIEWFRCPTKSAIELWNTKRSTWKLWGCCPGGVIFARKRICLKSRSPPQHRQPVDVTWDAARDWMKSYSQRILTTVWRDGGANKLLMAPFLCQLPLTYSGLCWIFSSYYFGVEWHVHPCRVEWSIRIRPRARTKWERYQDTNKERSAISGVIAAPADPAMRGGCGALA